MLRLQEGCDPLLVVLAHARERELVDVHVAGEIVQRVRQPADGQLGHRHRRLRRHRVGKCHRHGERLPGIGRLLDQSPFAGLVRADLVFGEDRPCLVRAGRSEAASSERR
ncbi:hypothetical protein HUU61_24380 [Rhodopseudomonas palustris]|nr:hypothetical protein [Rhodopseudomonas palustris]